PPPPRWRRRKLSSWILMVVAWWSSRAKSRSARGEVGERFPPAGRSSRYLLVEIRSVRGYWRFRLSRDRGHEKTEEVSETGPSVGTLDNVQEGGALAPPPGT